RRRDPQAARGGLHPRVAGRHHDGRRDPAEGRREVGVPRHSPPVTAGVDGQVVRGTSRLAAWSNFVKVAHTVFALPFTVIGIVAAGRHYPVRVTTVVITVLAFASARFAAMGFNRIVDVEFDRRNPRTAGRELPAGRMSLREAWILVLVA